jgi:hypothetical protein
LEDIGVDQRIILKLIFKRWNRVWLRVVAVGGLL